MDRLNIKLDLNKREKILAVLTAGILIPLILYQLVIVQLHAYQKNLERKNTALEKKINAVEQLGEELSFYERKNFRRHTSLSRRVDQVLRSLKLKDKAGIVVKDQKAKVQTLILKLKDINLTDLTRLTYQLENARPVIAVDNFELTPSFNNKKLLRASYVLSGR